MLNDGEGFFENKTAFFSQAACGNEKNPYFCSRVSRNDAEVAESVDASVSKTDEVTLVPVRSRPSVLQTPLNRLILRGFCFVKVY